MNRHGSPVAVIGTLFLVAGLGLLGWWTMTPLCAVAQIDGDTVVDIPGMGPTKLSDFSPEARKNIRVPGVQYDDPPEQFGDLPPVPMPPPNDAPPVDSQPSSRIEDTVRPVPAGRAGKSMGEGAGQRVDESESRSRQEMMKRMYEERAFPSEKIPEDAYIKAWNYIQQMQQAVPPVAPTPASQPQSRLFDPRHWLVRARDLLSPRPAFAQIPPTYLWAQIGPAPLQTTDGARLGGLIQSIAFDPQSPQSTVYLGTYGGGVWRTTNAGPTGTLWAPIADSQPQQLESIAVHPANSQMIFVGSGSSFSGTVDPLQPERSVGMLRTVDGGTTWCQIGPLCSDASHCPGPNPDYTQSALTVSAIAVENAGPYYRVWAATSKGLWYSDNAAYLTPTTGCTSVTWMPSQLPLYKADGVTRNTVNHIFVSPSSTQVLYASMINSDKSPSDNGWWKSTNHNGAWSHVLILQNSDLLQRASIRNCTPGCTPPTCAPACTSSTDVIWSIVGGKSFCPNGANSMYRTMDSGATWSRIVSPAYYYA